MQRWQCSIYNGTLETFIWSILWKTLPFCFLAWRLNIYDNSFMFPSSRNLNYIRFKTINIVSNSYLIRKRLCRYCCESALPSKNEGSLEFTSVKNLIILFSTGIQSFIFLFPKLRLFNWIYINEVIK